MVRGLVDLAVVGAEAVRARGRAWVALQSGVPASERRRYPAAAWATLAVALAAGGALPGAARLSLAALLAAVACTRPSGARWPALFWAAVAVAVLGGGLRAAAIDRSARPVPAASLQARPIVLTEALGASSRERTVSARGRLDGRAVVVVAPRFGRLSPALPRGAIALVSGPVVALGTGGGDERLRRAGVAGRVLASEIRWPGMRRGGVLGAIDRFGAAAQRELTGALGPRRGALVAGMALGISDGIGDGDDEVLRTSGLWHLVAASGGNIALVVALVMAIGWAVGLPDRWRLAVAALAICAYVPLAGAGPSIQRAGVMGLAALLAWALGREHRALDALALAATATLAVDPRAFLDVGWQLSFAAAAALIAAGPWATRRLTALGMPRWLAAGLACSLVATLATAPIMLGTFGEVSVIGLVANALVLPLVGVVVWSGALAAVITPLSPMCAGLVAQPAGAAAGLTLQIATWAASRSYAVLPLSGIAVLGAAVLLFWVVRPPRVVVLLVVFAGFGGLVWAVPRPPSEPRLVVFDIGQGNAALLQDGTDGVLVDAGPADGGVAALLRRTGVRRLRAVVLSHPAADHDGGGAAALSALPSDLVLDGGEPGGGPTHDAAIRVARRRGVRVVPARAGQTLTFGRIALRLRWPTPHASAQPGDPNDRAAVVEAQVGTLRALLPADAEGNVLRTLAHLRAAVLIVSHHGSDDDALPTVLRRLRPQLAVISVGNHNTYGHPTRATLGALQAARTPTLRTDQAGSLDIRADATGRVTVRPLR